LNICILQSAETAVSTRSGAVLCATEHDGPLSKYARARNTAALILRRCCSLTHHHEWRLRRNDLRDGSRATHESLGDLAPPKVVWLRTLAQVSLSRKRRVSGGHVRLHMTYAAMVRCCPVCIRPTHKPKGIYCDPLLMWHKMRATRCQHIKSLCAVDGGQPYQSSRIVDLTRVPPQYFCWWPRLLRTTSLRIQLSFQHSWVRVWWIWAATSCLGIFSYWFAEGISLVDPPIVLIQALQTVTRMQHVSSSPWRTQSGDHP